MPTMPTIPIPRDLNLCSTNITTSTKSSSSSSSNQSHPFSNPSSTLLVNNFNSLYDVTTNPSSDSDSEPEPDIATAFASQRFFFSSPGISNSIIHSSTTSSSSSVFENEAVAAEGTIAVSTYSPDPYVDFRRSMQEMVDERQVNDVGENWDYLHHLLMCYLSLNPKSTHKFILGAFADLIVTLTEKGSPFSNGKLNISTTRRI